MPPEMKYLDKLRLSRILILDYEDKAQGVDKELLAVAVEVMEETIRRVEYIEKITGGRKNEQDFH